MNVEVKSPSPSHLRAWLSLVLLSWQRQIHFRQMVWVALALLGISVFLVGARTATGRWGMHKRPTMGGRDAPATTYESLFDRLNVATETAGALGAVGDPTPGAVAAVFRALLERTDFVVFSNWVVFGIFVSFLLPLWSLSFATEALGGERESHSLLWLLTRPLPRPAIYLAKFVALLPWALALNVGGFALMCLASGRPGPQALALYWPAVLLATLTFASLFHLIGAVFRRPAVVALAYSFFLETILGNMPGYLKRVSVSFYTRCLMYEAASDYGVVPEKATVFLPVSGTAAAWTLIGLTAAFLVLGMVLFSRKEYVSLE